MRSRKRKVKEYLVPNAEIEHLAYEEVICASAVTFIQPEFGVEVKGVTTVDPADEGVEYFEF